MSRHFTEFWVACAAAGPVLLIPTYLMVRQQRAPGSGVQSGLSIASVAFLAAGTILALVELSAGTPVHGRLSGRIIEMVLICGPIAALVLVADARAIRRRLGAADGRGRAARAVGAIDRPRWLSAGGHSGVARHARWTRSGRRRPRRGSIRFAAGRCRSRFPVERPPRGRGTGHLAGEPDHLCWSRARAVRVGRVEPALDGVGLPATSSPSTGSRAAGVDQVFAWNVRCGNRSPGRRT